MKYGTYPLFSNKVLAPRFPFRDVSAGDEIKRTTAKVYVHRVSGIECDYLLVLRSELLWVG
jgi:hypothetical protein